MYCVFYGDIFSATGKKRYQLGDENEKKGWTNVLDSPVCWITSDNGNWNFFPSFLYFSIPAQQLIELSDKILTRSLFLLSVLSFYLSLHSFGTVGWVFLLVMLTLTLFNWNLRGEFDTFAKCHARIRANVQQDRIWWRHEQATWCVCEIA